MSLLAEVATILNAEGISFALIGATAMATYGSSRSTVDVDLLTLSDRALAPSVWSALAARGLVQRLARGDADDPLAGCVRLSDSREVVDVVVGRAVWQQDLVDNAVPRPLGSLTLPVVSPAGLVLLKLHAGGPKDAWDIRSLLEAVAETDAVVAEVERRIPSLSGAARQLWARLRSEG